MIQKEPSGRPRLTEHIIDKHPGYTGAGIQAVGQQVTLHRTFQ